MKKKELDTNLYLVSLDNENIIFYLISFLSIHFFMNIEKK